MLNWAPEKIAEAMQVAVADGVPAPCAAQLPYSLADTSVVEDESMSAVLREGGANVVSSYVLAGGALTGKYSSVDTTGRLAEHRAAERWQEAFRTGERLTAIAAELETTPARLAIAFALANETVASVLFGSTSPEQVADNVGALELLERLTDADLARLRG